MTERFQLKNVGVEDPSDERGMYRNPYDRNDHAFGAILGGGAEWDSENGLEIVIRGSEVLEVREYLGYGADAIWSETDESE